MRSQLVYLLIKEEEMKYLPYLLIFCWAHVSNSQYLGNIYQHQAEAGILDGTRKTFLVTGYSTSYRPSGGAWPSIFQSMLDQHAGNSNTYYVRGHMVGGTPIAKWTTLCGDGKHITNAITKYVNPGTSISGMPKATIMLAQQSLQWAFGDCDDRRGGITGPNDSVKIKRGSDAIELYTKPFITAGIKKVYMATHIYKTGSYPMNLCGEKYAMARALDQVDGLFPGPELCEVTQTLYPEGFAEDRVHPETEVAHAMALYWYMVIAGEAAQQNIMDPIAKKAGVIIPKPTAIDAKSIRIGRNKNFNVRLKQYNDVFNIYNMHGQKINLKPGNPNMRASLQTGIYILQNEETGSFSKILINN